MRFPPFLSTPALILPAYHFIAKALETRHMTEKPKFNKWLFFALMLAVAAFMYGSIMYKIIHHGA